MSILLLEKNRFKDLPKLASLRRVQQALNSVRAASSSPQHRRLPVGADLQGGEVLFRVWAPNRHTVDLLLTDVGSTSRTIRLVPEGNGYFSAAVEEAGAGTLSWYRFDSEKDLLPDPASRFQPEGPMGPSEIIDPDAFVWTDAAWTGVRHEGNVLYELHIGTFTKEGGYLPGRDRSVTASG